MRFLLDIMRAHGPIIVMAAAFLEKIGLPVPALAFLALAGCLIVEGPLSFTASLLAATAGAMVADLSWFCIGRRFGRRALYFFCRLALNPDSCVGRAEYYFRTRSATTILFSKLFPGVSMLVPPLAGILRMPLWRYVLLDVSGSLLWAGIGLGLGISFGAEVLARLASIQSGLLVLLAAIIAGFIVFKLFYRQYLVRRYSVPKVRAIELLDKINSGEEVMIVDLRNEEAFTNSQIMIPGARRFPPAHFDKQSHLVPKDREIVLYCT